MTSFVLSAGNLVILKLVPDTSSILEISAYLLGGPFGIVASMYAHKRMMGRKP